MKKIKYFAIIAASIFTLTSCTDIVEVDDLKAKENKPSTGAPTVDKVVLATDAEFPIEGANFEQVVRIEGTNLGDITSLKFNDIEVDSKEIYSTYDMLLAPIPEVHRGFMDFSESVVNAQSGKVGPRLIITRIKYVFTTRRGGART